MLGYSGAIHSGVGGNAAILPGPCDSNFRSQKPCYAGVKLDSDGGLYCMTPDGQWSFVDSWLLTGANTVHQVVRTIDSGTLSTDAGAGPLALSSDRSYEIINASWSTVKTTLITLELQLVSDSSFVDSRQYTLEAELI